MSQPEHGVVVGEHVRHERVLGHLHELRDVRAHGRLPLLLRRGAIDLASIPRSPAVELRLQLLHHQRFGHREPERRRLRLIGRKDVVRLRQQLLPPRKQLAQRPLQIAREQERCRVRARRKIRDEGLHRVAGAGRKYTEAGGPASPQFSILNSQFSIPVPRSEASGDGIEN